MHVHTYCTYTHMHAHIYAHIEIHSFSCTVSRLSLVLYLPPPALFLSRFWLWNKQDQTGLWLQSSISTIRRSWLLEYRDEKDLGTAYIKHESSPLTMVVDWHLDSVLFTEVLRWGGSWENLPEKVIRQAYTSYMECVYGGSRGLPFLPEVSLV